MPSAMTYALDISSFGGRRGLPVKAQRRVCGTLKASASHGVVPPDGVDDPVFQMIAAYNRASADLAAANAHHDAVFVQGKTSRAEIAELDRIGGEAFHVEQSALEAVVRMSPTTLAGLAAWSEFLLDHMDRLVDQGDEDVVFSGTVKDLLTSIHHFAGS